MGTGEEFSLSHALILLSNKVLEKIVNMDEKKPNYILIAAIIGACATIIAALIAVYGAIRQASLPIEATETAEALHTSIAMTAQTSFYATGTFPPPSIPTSPLVVTPVIAETFTPLPLPLPSYSAAVISVNNFFSLINNAQTADDLLGAWNLESNSFQCLEAAGCDPVKFQNFWINWKVQYRLYDCGANIVDTAQIYYPKNPLSGSSPTDWFFRRYQLIEEGGQLKINEGSKIESPDTYCPLVISVP